ncbi:MAG TPA: hypothetical protein VF367_05265 [Candidatus Limnocylindria bacterium]|jgi:hypothetical protein
MAIKSTGSIVLVSCPKTGELVPSGFWADTLDELEAENELLDCPACGSDHRWTPPEAILGWAGNYG